MAQQQFALMQGRLLHAHPLLELFPELGEDDFAALKESIRESGQLVPIPIDVEHGFYLDGRARLRACDQLGIEPRFEPAPAGDAQRHVLALNLERRHLSTGQRAALADRLATFPWGGARSKTLNEALTRAEAAERMGVSRASLERYRRVTAAAAPHITAAVEAGALSLPDAERLAALPQETQAALEDPEALQRAVRELRKPAVKQAIEHFSGRGALLRARLADPLERAYAEANPERAEEFRRARSLLADHDFGRLEDVLCRGEALPQDIAEAVPPRRRAEIARRLRALAEKLENTAIRLEQLRTARRPPSAPAQAGPPAQEDDKEACKKATP